MLHNKLRVEVSRNSKALLALAVWRTAGSNCRTAIACCQL